MIEQLIRKQIDGGCFPGIVLLVEHDGKKIIDLAMGSRGLGEYETPMTPDSLFDLASLTKPLATTTTFLALAEAQGINLQKKAGYFLSGLNPEAAELSLTELMTHTSGLPPVPEIFRLFKTEEDISEEEGIRHLMSIVPEVPPGTEVIYSCTGYILLTRILTAVAGCPLAEAYTRLIAEPAGVVDLGFNPGPDERKRAVPTEYCGLRRRMLIGEVHDENSYCLGGQGGNAGLFGTASSVSALAGLFCCEGWLNGRQIISAENVEKMTTPQSGRLFPPRALGFLTQCSESFAGEGFSDGAFGHTGFTGTSLWIDNSRKLKVTALTNRVHLGREQTADKIKAFRKILHREILRLL